MKEWFEDWFGETYLDLYQHRDERDAAAAVNLIADTVSLRGEHVLDLACGPGRHSDLIRDRVARVVGLDLSAPLLRKARADTTPPISVVRADMRSLPFTDQCFDAVVNFFTSFGYFDTDEQHSRVIQEVFRILRTDGWFVLDYFNASLVKDSLVAHEEINIGGRKIEVKRWISDDCKFVFKDMKLLDEGRSYLERVRLFEPHELERLLVAEGFMVTERRGSYEGAPLDDNSPRALFFSVRR